MKDRALQILLVEDNPDHAELVRRSLEQLPPPLRSHWVEDGETALAYLLGDGQYADREQFPEPDLVLLDLHLPRMDGLEVLRRVQAQQKLRSLTIVILTTSEAERDVGTAYEYHAHGFLTKPVDFQRLSQMINDLEPNRDSRSKKGAA